MGTPTRQPDELRDEEPDEYAGGVRAQHEEAKAARGRFDFERGWMAAACVLLFASATLLYLGLTSAAFVLAALGISAWFLNVRNDLKRKHDLVKRGGRNWEPRGRGE